MQQNQTGKTKTAMLLELESIKDLLVEADDIPILQEVVLHIATPDAEPLPPADDPADSFPEINTPNALAAENIDAPISAEIAEQTLHESSPVTIPEETTTTTPDDPAATTERQTPYREEQQQDFFPLSIGRAATAQASHTEDHSSTAKEPGSAQANAIPNQQRPAPAKASGQNPFLPEHIRARLQGNTSLATENPARNSPRNAITASVPAQKPSNQQQLINEIMDKMLPEVAKELRGRLVQMSKPMLEELLAEHSR